jgi:hypothetical protein
MNRRLFSLTVLPLIGLALAAGCSSNPTAPGPNEEESVRQAFASLQAALKARDADRVWGLLDADSRAEAERAAQAVRDAYAKVDAAGRSEQEKALGVPGAELADLKGPGFLKTKRFHGKYDEVPESKVDKVAVQGDRATVNYTEPDGDKEKLTLVRQEGQWRVSLPMPKAQP